MPLSGIPAEVTARLGHSHTGNQKDHSANLCLRGRQTKFQVTTAAKAGIDAHNKMV